MEHKGRTNAIEYKGYTGVIEIDQDAGVLYGRVLGLRDVITFQGETVAEARKAFQESVDDYLEFCEERGEAPEKPYSGKFVLRVDPAIHRRLATQAEAKGVSLNTHVSSILMNAAFSVPSHDSGGVLYVGSGAIEGEYPISHAVESAGRIDIRPIEE
jgi:predicted HicB family RNase H-like nuclease